MKKIILSMVVLTTLAVSVSSCKKAKDAINCVDVVKKYGDAENAYTSNGSKESCIALKAAIAEYINSNCVTPELKASLQLEDKILVCQ
jgi:hypothetical protein